MQDLILSPISVPDLVSLIASEVEVRIKNNGRSSNTPEPENDTMKSLQEVADFLNRSKISVQKLKNTGVLPYKQMGRKLYFSKKEIMAAMLEYKPRRRRA